MEPLWIFSAADNSIDFAGGLMFLAAAFYSVKYLCINNISTQGKILYALIAIISSVHVFQVLTQIINGGPVFYTFRTWDFINYLTAVLLLMLAHRLHNKEKYYKQDKQV